MTVKWSLKRFIASSEEVYNVTGFQALIQERTGVRVSLQQLCNLVNRKPKSIRISTIEIICSALNCKLSDFLEVEKSERILKRRKKTRKLAVQNTPKSKLSLEFPPNPYDYQK